jgi:predicted nucleotide-binding protein
MPENTTKLKVFIASSTQSLEYAYAVQSNLAGIECTVWDQDVFELNGNVLDSLEKVLEIVDFGVFVFGNDDVIVKGGTKISVTRDNVIYELGLFTGRLGRMKLPQHS